MGGGLGSCGEVGLGVGTSGKNKILLLTSCLVFLGSISICLEFGLPRTILEWKNPLLDCSFGLRQFLSPSQPALVMTWVIVNDAKPASSG